VNLQQPKKKKKKKKQKYIENQFLFNDKIMKIPIMVFDSLLQLLLQFIVAYFDKNEIKNLISLNNLHIYIFLINCQYR